MDTTRTAETRQRILKWIEEGQSLLSLLPGLLEDTERVHAQVAAAEQECERLRQENAGLRKEQDEIVGAFGKLMAEMLRPMNEMMQKIRGTQSTPKKSPFEREVGSASPVESVPATAPGLTKF